MAADTVWNNLCDMPGRRLKSLLLVLSLITWTGSLTAVSAGEITPDGEKLAATLDSMHVEQLWISGRQVNWRTGVPDGKVYTNANTHTHCSAFAAAAAERLGVYLLHPPEHSATLLANAQQDWLLTAGIKQGWYQVDSPLKAQELANEGQLVVVTFKNPKSDVPGHIAIVRPSDKSDQDILAEGPQIIQAGAQNFSSTTVKNGFKHHPGAFENNQVLYFSHVISPSKIALQATPEAKSDQSSSLQTSDLTAGSGK